VEVESRREKAFLELCFREFGVECLLMFFGDTDGMLEETTSPSEYPESWRLSFVVLDPFD